MGAVTIGVIAWADDHYDTATARTMGMTSFAIANLFYSFCERDERIRSSASTSSARPEGSSCFSARRCVAIILAPQLNLLNRISRPRRSTLHQWLICIVPRGSPRVVTEIRKLVLRPQETPSARSPGG
jgi:hypothetical protein